MSLIQPDEFTTLTPADLLAGLKDALKNLERQIFEARVNGAIFAHDAETRSRSDTQLSSLRKAHGNLLEQIAHMERQGEAAAEAASPSCHAPSDQSPEPPLTFRPAAP